MCASWNRHAPLSPEEFEELCEWLREGGSMYQFAQRLGRGTDSWLKVQLKQHYGTTHAEIIGRHPKARVPRAESGEWIRRASAMCSCYGAPRWFQNIINSETEKRWK